MPHLIVEIETDRIETATTTEAIVATLSSSLSNVQQRSIAKMDQKQLPSENGKTDTESSELVMKRTSSQNHLRT